MLPAFEHVDRGCVAQSAFSLAAEAELLCAGSGVGLQIVHHSSREVECSSPKQDLHVNLQQTTNMLSCSLRVVLIAACICMVASQVKVCTVLLRRSL